MNSLCNCLTGRSHGLLHGPLDTELSLLELVSGGVLLLKDLEGLGDLGLDVGSSSSLDLGGEFWGGDGLLACVQVSLEVGFGLVLGGEVLVGVLEPIRGLARTLRKLNSYSLLGVLDHSLDLVGR
jgi:hypothetical protein